jgi:hypothetical protein
MAKYILFGFTLVCAGFAIGAQSTDEVKLVEERCGPHVAALLSDDPQVRCNAYQDWLRQRTAQMQFLAKLADQGKARNDACDSRELAIRMLGDLKYCDHVLFRNMDWKRTGPITGREPLAAYPCAESITASGERAVPLLFDYFSSSPEAEFTEKRIVLGAIIMLVVYGKERQDAAVRAIENRLAVTEPDRQANLKRLLKAVQRSLTDNEARLDEIDTTKAAATP